MRPFAIGSLVRPKNINIINDREIREVTEVFKSVGKIPIGVVKNYNNGLRIFIDWGIEGFPFHSEGIDFRLPRPTGYWVDIKFLELAYEPYNPGFKRVIARCDKELKKMIVSKKSGKERKLVAVMGINGTGLWFRSSIAPDVSYYIDQNGIAMKDNYSLEQLVKNSERTPVYEGEEITLKF